MTLTNARILVTNDDGIAAHGLVVLERIAHALSDDVWICAPEQEQSGASHSLSLHMPVRLRKLAEKRFAVSGTPTDCVLLALQEAVPVKEKPVKLVLSGVNRGSNAADDVTYSGTVAAAMEGAILGVPSIALSQLYEDDGEPYWQTAEAHAPELIKQLYAIGWPAGSLININFPHCTPEAVKGIRICPQGKRKVSVALTPRLDVKGRPYYWIGGERDNRSERPDVDIAFLHDGYITITPLNLDLTDYAAMENLRSNCQFS